MAGRRATARLARTRRSLCCFRCNPCCFPLKIKPTGIITRRVLLNSQEFETGRERGWRDSGTAWRTTAARRSGAARGGGAGVAGAHLGRRRPRGRAHAAAGGFSTITGSCPAINSSWRAAVRAASSRTNANRSRKRASSSSIFAFTWSTVAVTNSRVGGECPPLLRSSRLSRGEGGPRFYAVERRGRAEETLCQASPRRGRAVGSWLRLQLPRPSAPGTSMWSKESPHGGFPCS